ncbi:hypothetical protein MBLNU13_g05531t1 [Cladosporium sp. NU13]
MRSILSLSPTPTPFHSSHLALPPSPFTPQIPISPPSRSPNKPTTFLSKIPLSLPPPPQEPLKWLWQCHQCARIYHLGTTRRCLDDGHYFCAGAPVTKRDRKTGQKVTRKSRACASEFDYQGWRTWGVWRRDVEEQRAAAEALRAFEMEEEAVESDGELRVEDGGGGRGDVPRPLFAKEGVQEGVWFSGVWGRKSEITARDVMALPEKDCWGTCDYPSECRWGKQFGTAQAQAQAQAVVAPVAVSSPPPPPAASMVDEPVAKDVERRSKNAEKLSTLPATIEEMPEVDEAIEILDHIHEDPSTLVQETTKKPTLDDLLESAKRRKRRSAGNILPSPLASNPPSPTERQREEQAQAAASAHTLQKAFDDFELDLKKSIGRASVLLNGFVSGLKGSGLSEEEKSEAFVKGLRTDRKERRTAKEEDGQSLSD